MVSKEASNEFWNIATHLFWKLFKAKDIQDITRKIPQFVHIRRQQYKSLPVVEMEIGYLHKESGSIKKSSSYQHS